MELLQLNKFLTFFGGEHSVSIGIIKAFYEKYSNFSVLHIDAHADLRPEYMGSKYNHACALHDASRNTHVVQVGIRSMDESEMEFIDEDTCFYAHEMLDEPNWIENAVRALKDNVYSWPSGENAIASRKLKPVGAINTALPVWASM